MHLGGALIAVIAWVALGFVVAGTLYLLSLCFRGEFADDASSDQPHGDIPFIPEDLKIGAGHNGGITR